MSLVKKVKAFYSKYHVGTHIGAIISTSPLAYLTYKAATMSDAYISSAGCAAVAGYCALGTAAVYGMVYTFFKR